MMCRIRDGINDWIATVAMLPRDESEYVKTSNSAVWTNTRIRTGYAVPERHIIKHTPLVIASIAK